ncbi:hypothetical protein ACFCXT_34675 [Streptomyces vinaceus]|uniref:hypothetical protein n=1 Tax=Streptomyces vinaceus TaxID=1960 RepID=UPI0035D9F8DB
MNGPALGSIGLGAVSAHQIPFQPPQAPPQFPGAPAPMAPVAPQVVVIPPMPAYRPYRSSAWLVLLLGLPQFAFFVFVILLGNTLGLTTGPTVLVIWLTSLLMALFGLIRGLFLLRGPSSVLVYLGTALSLGVVVVLLLAAQAGQIPGVRI